VLLNVSNVIICGTRKVSAEASLSTHISPKTLDNQLFKKIRIIGNGNPEKA